MAQVNRAWTKPVFQSRRRRRRERCRVTAAHDKKRVSARKTSIKKHTNLHSVSFSGFPIGDRQSFESQKMPVVNQLVRIGIPFFPPDIPR